MLNRMFASLTLGGLLALPLVSCADEPVKPTPIGEKVANTNSLRDLRGGKRALHGFKDNKAVVLLFLGAECPVSNLYLPTLIELEKEYRDKKVQFLAVYPNEPEDLDQVAAHAYDRDLPILALKDFGQRLATSIGITRVPSVAVLDGDFTLRYRGRIDDRYGASIRKPKATRDDLTEAIAEVVAGQKVAIAETEADGCLIAKEIKLPSRKDVTFAKDVAPILQIRCQSCHRPDQNAPFSLLTYEDAAKHANMIREVTTQRRMPPWHADARFGHFSNDRRLSNDELSVLTSWADSGMPRGNDKDLPKPIDWPKGWVHGTPDLILQMPEEYEVKADGVLPYQNWIIDPDFKEDLGEGRRSPARHARRGPSHRRLHSEERFKRPGQRRRRHRDSGRLGAGRSRPGHTARYRFAPAEGLQIAARGALHAHRQGRQGSFVDRHHVRQGGAEV
jgi:thiol-disulfide isomerase/thioredoxin